MTEETASRLYIPPKFESLFTPNSDPVFDEDGDLVRPGHKRKRYYIRYGGRSGFKSHQFATAVILRMHTGKEFVVCAREVHKSMSDSVHKLLVNKIDGMGLRDYFDITDNELRSKITGSTAIFKGLGLHIKENLKSVEGATITWIEEADDVTKYSWSILIPTVVRTQTSEIWISFNTGLETDATYVRFVKEFDPKRMDIEKVTVLDMPRHLVPDGVWEEMEADKASDYDAYLNTWEGFPLKAKDGGVFRPEKINLLPAAPAGLRYVRGWDFASSAAVNGKDPDWTVGFKLGINPETLRYCIVDVIRFRGRPEEVEAQLVTTTQNDGIDVQQDLPTDPGSAGAFAVTNFTKKLAGYRVVTSVETGSKLTRGEVFAAQVNVGNVDMVQAPWNDVVTQELKSFNGDKKQKDDIVDAGSRAFSRLQTKQYMTKLKIW